ncbi:hypothetical protein PPTG_04087 [Phytophthora nicotianae INRA-310]|uniref:Uncharacterized protein n=1 Tax=Phytophthora nicotianae (strain INRA-310) TaxID=761204 RepID=W2QZ63_PHYN3|nr:hypothetical protein PPTG_04087 [Phytophthora nicotianae INRA-310]ETN18497.1 hypothetical protein PPTG_04087 [Phytophthora nicotianae INRA-310]
MAEPYVDPITFQLMWYQLTKKGWSFRKSVGLSNDQRYVPPDGNVKGTEGVDVFVGEKSLVKHCMQQGWFPEYLGLPPGVPPRSTTPSSTPPPETPSHPTPPRSTPPTTVPSQTALSATAGDPVQGPDAHLSVAAPSTPPAAAKSATRIPKPAAKASKPPTKSKRKPAPPKRKAAPKARLSKRRHTDEAITEERQCVPESCEVPFPSEAVRVTDSGQFAVPDVMEDVVESAKDDIPDEFQRETTRARDPRFVTLDDFDSDGFLTALRRDRLFEPLDSDDLNGVTQAMMS